MFRFFSKKARHLARIARQGQGDGKPTALGPLVMSLDKNIETTENLLGKGNDIVYHPLSEDVVGRRIMIVYLDGMCAQKNMSEMILRPLVSGKAAKPGEAATLDDVKLSILTAGECKEVTSFSDLVSGCLTGDTALMMDGFDKALIISTKGWEQRSVSDPSSESVVRGPRESFTENLRTNTTLIRRRIPTHDFKVEHMIIGERTRTSVCIAYIDGIADPDVLAELKRRLEGICVDAIMDSGYIEEYIEDAPFSIFPTVSYSEKPDVIAARVLEGRIAIVVDGSPYVLCVPMLFYESFQSAEDYYIRYFPATLNRIIRTVAFIVTVFAPSVYIALTSFHQELLPTKLLFTIIGARASTPFLAFMEVLFLLITFEILREAGLRLPRPVGQAVSIVGALTLGEAAVSAGLVGAPVVIVTAITAVSSFVVPSQTDAISITRLVILILISCLGIFGLVMGLMGLLIHLASLESFGVPYYMSLPLTHDIKDTFIRAPLWWMNRRPSDIAQKDKVRSRFFIPPMRPHKKREDGDDA